MTCGGTSVEQLSTAEEIGASSIDGDWANGLRARRLALGVSQVELARRSGLTQQAISYMERGVGIPRVTTMLRIVRALGTTIEDIFGPERETR